MTFDHDDNELLRAVVDGILDAVITIDERGHIQSFNRTAEKMFGYTAREVIGRNVSLLMTSEHRDNHDGYLERYQTTGERRIIGIGREVDAMRKDGSTFPIDLGVTEHSANGRKIYIGVLRDITARRDLERALVRSQKLEAVGTLAAGVAHDFNNLLMGIRGCMQLAATKIPEGSPAERFLEEARSAADRGTRLTRQLLAFARRTPTEHRRFRLNDVVEGADTLMARLLGPDIELVTALDAELDEIIGDPGQIEQVVINLVINARDAINDGAGRIQVSTSNVDRTIPSSRHPVAHIRLTVEDDGDGMDEATTTRIFEPFYTTKPPDQGTGLGLSTVYGITEEHNGTISVRSELGAGTIFDVDIPLVSDP